MIQFILIALAGTVVFVPGIIYGMHNDKMGADTKKLFLIVWFLLAFTVFSTVYIIKG